MGRYAAAALAGALLLAGCGGPAEPPEQSASTAAGLANGCGPAPSRIVLSPDYTTYDQMLSHAVEMPVDAADPTAGRLSELGLPSRVGDLAAAGVGNEPGRPHPSVGTVYYADQAPDGLMLTDVLDRGAVVVTVGPGGGTRRLSQMTEHWPGRMLPVRVGTQPALLFHGDEDAPHRSSFVVMWVRGRQTVLVSEREDPKAVLDAAREIACGQGSYVG